MSKIFIVMGKSATGKDTIFKQLIQNTKIHLKTIIPYTTRPARTGEKDGVEYFFVTEEKMHMLEQTGKIAEMRKYETVHGNWYYFTADDGQINRNETGYIMITTLDAYEKLRNYYGEDRVVPIYIEVEDGERLSRALEREKKQKEPKYNELCRRYLADQEDFKENNLMRLGISKRYLNRNLETCVGDILSDIVTML